MAWRIDEAVIRGEIDNRERGHVTGRIWLVGRDEPVTLELAGNAWRDLAGRRLEFENPTPVAGRWEDLATRQTGVIGDCTASRKVKVPEIPLSQIGEYHAAKKPWPWHWGNCLYLEWFSETNGRVVIEPASYRLTVSPDSTWDMTASEEEAQRRANGAALTGFMERLNAAGGEAEPATESGAEDELSEEAAEKMQEENDRLLDRIEARLEREGPDADYERILAEEIERRRHERGELPLTPEEEAQRAEWVDEMNRLADDAQEHPDPAAAELARREHPLVRRTHELATRLRREPRANGWIDDHAREEHPLVDLGIATMKAGAKLAGALNGQDWPPDRIFAANHIVRLKRARGYLEDAVRAVDVGGENALAEAAWLAEVRSALTEVADECDALIEELRARLQRGFD